MIKKNKKHIVERAENILQIREKRAFMKLGDKLRAYFFTGVLVTAPVVITFYVAYKIIMWIDNGVAKLLPPQFKEYYSTMLPYSIPGLGVVVLIIAMIFVGMFAAGFLGKFFIRLGEWILRKVPFLSSVYSLLKQIFESFLSNKKQSFSKVVLFEYPRKGIWILGFLSSETDCEVKKILKKDMYNIFVPTTPNPTSGFFVFVPKEEVTLLDMSVEEGLKFIISCGIVSPEQAVAMKKRNT
jgi:uncharacterized membrane protein